METSTENCEQKQKAVVEQSNLEEKLVPGTQAKAEAKQKQKAQAKTASEAEQARKNRERSNADESKHLEEKDPSLAREREAEHAVGA